MPATGTPETRLIVLRGNSGSGKSTLAAGLRARYGRGLAIVGHDAVRRGILGEKERRGGAAPGLIDAIARYTLDAGRHTVVEGILRADLYGPMLSVLAADHRGTTCFAYLDIPWEETLSRHSTRAKAAEFGAEEMRGWFRPRDVLPGGCEHIIGAGSTVAESVDLLIARAGLGE